MIKIFSLVLLVLALISCQQPPRGFEVVFDLKNATDCFICVSQKIPNQTTWYTDTLRLKDGKAVFKGQVDYPRFVSFVFKNSDEEFYGTCGLFLDNEKVKVTGDFKNLRNVIIEGGRTQQEYATIMEGGKDIFGKYKELSYVRGKAFKDNRHVYDSLTPLVAAAYNKVVEYILSLPDYSTSKVAPYFVREYFKISDVEMLEQALDAFDASMSTNAYVAFCREELDAEKRVQLGQAAYNFSLQDLEGKTYKLSDFRGKYVLLEFSASWCGWCKLEIPYLQRVYQNTKNKNFVMFTINLDEERTKWEDDVKKHDLPWTVLSDLQGFKSPVAKNYNVSGIPMIYLINPEGLIEEKGLRREHMIDYINNLFKK